MSIYQKRWSSCGSGTTPTASNVLSSGVEPSTVGTSWNSVRWNKPSTSYRASLASRFEKPDVSSIYTPQRSSRYSLSSAAKNAADMASIGPSVSSRASRFDSLTMPNKEKYRSEARELINKWSSRERTSVGSSGNNNNSNNNNTNSSSPYRSSYEPTSARNSLTTSTYSTPSYRTSTSLTPTRSTMLGGSAPSVASRYSVERKSVLSPSPTPTLHTTPKAERPWRQRLAESSRIRSTLGDDVSEGYSSRRARNASSRRGSLSQDGGESSCYEFSYSGALGAPMYRTRQSSAESSLFSPSSRFTTSTYPSLTSIYRKLDIPSTTRSKSPIRDETVKSIIRESSKEREATRKKSVRERTARRASRQNSQQDSSSDDNDEQNKKDRVRIRSRSNSAQRLRKLRKKSEVLEGVQYKVPVAEIEKEKEKEINKSMQSSLYETGAEDGSIVPVPMGTAPTTNGFPESEGFQSCAASPLVPSISRSSSKNGVVKNQVIKSPSLIEVLGVSAKDENRDDVVLTDLEMLDVEASESSRIDDESQYSAVVHFKPKKRVGPVPGMWKSVTENEEFISRNKTIHRSEEFGEVEMIIKILRTIEKIEKSLKAVEKKMVKKEKDAEKKKVIVTKRKKASPIELKVKEDPVNKEKVKSPETPKKTELKTADVTKKTVAISKPKEPEVAKKPVAKPAENKDKTEAVKKVEPKEKSAPEVKPDVKKPAKSAENEKKEVEVKKPVMKKETVEETKIKTEVVTKKAVNITKPKELPTETKEITKYFTPKNKQSALKTEIKRVMKHQRSLGLKCKAAGNEKISLTEQYRRRMCGERATVLVDTPVDGKNHSVVKMTIRVPVIIPKPSVLPIDEMKMSASFTSFDSEISRSCSRTSETRASVILDEMRNREADVEWIAKGDEDISDELILPDQSILEQYVNRKRRRFRPSSICSSRGYESSNCASPCPSTVSELCLPSSVIIHEPRKRAPNSAEPTVQLNSTPKGFTRNPPVAAVKPVSFEAPKTLFEKMIQDQANRNRKSLNIESDTETRDPSPQRRGSSQEEGMSSISSQFAAAAAAGNSAHGQVRYAAHIPLNRNDSTTSGRVSTTSIDSQQSGALDVASKNIDHVIDQARHRHHQHRNKFKEAIDYLDQIFEDLKKECDVDEKNNNGKETSTPPVKSPKTRNIQVIKETQTPPPSINAPIAPTVKKVVKPVAVRAKPTPKLSQQKELKQHTQSPVEVVIPVRKLSEEEENQEPNIAETIVLKKTDKMDFTRRWLQDDLCSLAHLPPANIAPHISYYQDFDEHSLGSCSAEVAAFNTVKERKQSKSSRKTSDTSDPVRPRPFRPQPVYPISSDPVPQNQQYQKGNTLPRVTSTDEMRRSGSQDPYSTLRSMRSEGENSSPSAFQSFNRGGSMRSSLRSLPDHSPVRRRTLAPPDPIMSIDQLVAELELNTDQPATSIEKRRSFPTSFVRPTMNEYERPRYRVVEPSSRRQPQQTYTQPESIPKVTKAPTYRPKQQNSLDDVTNMLSKVVSSNDRQSYQNPSVYKQLSQQSFGSIHSNNAFETINQEKINPSRVEAMHNMFEKGTAPTAWKKMSPLQESQYATLNSYSPPIINNNSNYSIAPQHQINNNSNRYSQPQQQQHEYTPQVPTSQPPQRPPGSANSSQGGYYSSNSSGVGSNYPPMTNPNTRRSLVIDQQSISSRVPSVDEDDDGFYDNIGIYDDRRYSRGSELEASSSFRLPPSSSSSNNNSQNGTKHRIGSFLRKIGNATSRPPGSAASLLSLNKLSNETVMKPAGGLMKSNSLSTEPWKKQVMREQQPKGLGARLKNSIFGGSRKRLDG